MDFVMKLIFTVCLAGCIFVDAVQADGLAINCTLKQIFVNETSPTNLTTITANKTATFSIGNETGGGNFFSIHKNGTLIISTLDVETLKRTGFNVTIVANSSLIDRSNCTVNINITDLNDNAPNFPQKEYTVNLQDHPRKGSSVINLTVTDNDLTLLNKAVRYSLDGPNKDDFAIDEAGHVTVNASNVSSAEIHSYHLKVYAINKESPPLNGTAKLTICVGNCGSSGDTIHTWSILTLVGSFFYVLLLQGM